MDNHARTETKKSLILTAYSLSALFEHALRDVIGQGAQTVTVAQLRSQGITGLLRQLWSMRGDPIVLPIEEENSSALLPVLKLLAACTRSHSICVVHPDLRCEVVSRWQIAIDALRFASASVSCLWSAYRARRELSALLKQDREGYGSLTVNGAVLYLKTNLWFGIKAGGSVGHIAGVVNGLQRLGYPVTFASAEPPVMTDAEVKFLHIQPPKAFGLPYELNNYRFQEDFSRALNAVPDLASTNIIYQRLSAANYLGVVVSRRNHWPLIVEYNGSEVWISKHWGSGLRFENLANMAEEVMLRHAHLVVTISDVLKNELINRGVEENRIVCYPNCIDPIIFNPANYSFNDVQKLRIKHFIREDSVLVTFIGTFGKWHGVENLARCIVKLIKDEINWLEKYKVHFLIVGDGLLMPDVRNILGGHAAGKFVTLTGLIPQAEAPLYLAASDILVSPHVKNSNGTEFFGSPTKLFEYMAMGKAIVASNLNQIGQVLDNSPKVEGEKMHPGEIADNAPALLVTPGNIEDLIWGIKHLVENEDLRSLLGDNARKLALNKYTWMEHVRRIISSINANKI